MIIKTVRKVALGMICFLLATICVLCQSVTLKAASDKETNPEKVIERFVDCVNNQDIQGYIQLFASEISSEMKRDLNENEKQDFFVESGRSIINIKRIEYNYTLKEKDRFSEVLVFRVTEQIKYKKDIRRDTCKLRDGINIDDFVMVKENGKWLIYRISAADVGQDKATANLSCPSSITVYFTKAANASYYKIVRKELDFNTYLKGVLPKEWTISYFNSYPAYGRAGAMASKMYGWYYRIHPKWNFSPYFADVKDNSSDQNFLHSAYFDMAPVYQRYEDTVLSFISNRAMVKESNNSLFEVHYHRTNGSQHSGTLSESGCLAKAKNGESYSKILHYYYDKSQYTGTSINCKIVTY